MRICRFDNNRLGVIDGDDEVTDVTTALSSLPPLSWPVPHVDHLIRNCGLMRDRYRRRPTVAEDFEHPKSACSALSLTRRRS